MFLRQLIGFGPLILLSLLGCGGIDSPVDATRGHADRSGEDSAALSASSALGEQPQAERPPEFLTLEHIEVAPGVFFVREAIESGKIKLLDAGFLSPDDPASAQLKKGDLMPMPERRKQPGSELLSGCVDCFDDDSDDFAATLAVPYPPFGLAGLGIYDSLYLNHYEQICNGCTTYEYTSISVNLSSYGAIAGSTLELFSSFFVNGEYVGAVDTSIVGMDISYFATFSALCVGGQITVDAYPYHAFSIAGSYGAAGSALHADVKCGSCCN